MTFEEKILSHKNKRITKQELEKYAETTNTKKLYQFIAPLTEKGLLVPIKSASTNGNMVFTIYSKYHIVRQEKDDSKAIREIQKLHTALLKSEYLQRNPELYEHYQKQLLQLNRFFFSEAGIAEPISRKERSFALFGEEKQLDDRSFLLFLKKLGLTSDELAFYDTPEYCFHDYIHESKKELKLLICENKDIWFDLRRMMFEQKKTMLWGQTIHGVVYGCGDKICKANALTEYTNFMGDVNVHYLYWGDIDREGLNIFIRTVKVNPELNIDLFVPAYQRMLELAKNHSIPASTDYRGLMQDYSSIFALFPIEDRNRLKKTIDDNLRIPQEIVNYRILLEEME